MLKNLRLIILAIDLAYKEDGLEPVIYVNGELYPITGAVLSDDKDDTIDKGTPILFVQKSDAQDYLDSL